MNSHFFFYIHFSEAWRKAPGERIVQQSKANTLQLSQNDPHPVGMDPTQRLASKGLISKAMKPLEPFPPAAANRDMLEILQTPITRYPCWLCSFPECPLYVPGPSDKSTISANRNCPREMKPCLTYWISELFQNLSISRSCYRVKNVPSRGNYLRPHTLRVKICR